MGTILLVALAIFGLALGLGGRTTEQYESLTGFDLNRYLGRWYEIARTNNRFERELDYVTAEYILQDNGKIKVINRGYNQRKGRLQESVGKAKTTDINGHLRVSFFLSFYSDYDILAISENYSWALVGSGKNFLWILSRTPSLPESELESILDIARRFGYDTDKLIFPVQKPSEMSQSMGNGGSGVRTAAMVRTPANKKVKEPVA
ncbi:MAG: lipocalin family protein [Alistipes sp.]|nr:lipocalin family protein [Alistipes sp.]